VLREVGLVRESRCGRQRIYVAEPEPLRDLQRWLSPYERFWRSKLSDLRDFLDDPDAPTPTESKESHE
jgi:hypothetical protein